MKKIILFISLVLVAGMYSCNEDSLGVSKVTTYATMTLNGSDDVFWPMNKNFVDPGCLAFEGDKNISDKIEITSDVDVTKGGKYNINYKVANSDGFYASASRTVYVYDATSSYNGYYTSNISRTNTNTAAVSKRGPYKILVMGVGDNKVWIEDLMGGWYYYGSGYGVGYAGTSILSVNVDNTLSVVKSYATSFGSSSACVLFSSSTYDAASKTFVLHANMGDTPYLQFNVTLNNPSSFN